MTIDVDWVESFRAWGWTACPCATDKDQAHMAVAHPQYGILTCRMVMTYHECLTHLARMTPLNMDLPVLHCGTTTFTDVVRDEPHLIVGILWYLDTDGVPQSAPMTLVRHASQWLPYVEVNEWVCTGWDSSGKLKHEFKPLGWDGELLGGCTDRRASTCESHAL